MEELPITPADVDRVNDMVSYDRRADGLAFRDRTGTLLEQVDPETFDTLTSSHGTTVLNRPGVALARDVPLTNDEGHIPAITEDQTGKADAEDDVADVTTPAGLGAPGDDDGDDVEEVGPFTHDPPPQRQFGDSCFFARFPDDSVRS